MNENFFTISAYGKFQGLGQEHSIILLAVSHSGNYSSYLLLRAAIIGVKRAEIPKEFLGLQVYFVRRLRLTIIDIWWNLVGDIDHSYTVNYTFQ